MMLPVTYACAIVLRMNTLTYLAGLTMVIVAWLVAQGAVLILWYILGPLISILMCQILIGVGVCDAIVDAY
jgi:hypothetical protein